MRVRVPRMAVVAGVMIAIAVASGRVEAAPPKESALSCTKNAERAQVLRREGKLGSAREALRECAVDACPAVVRDDCRTWTAELQAAQPTVVFSVRDRHGADLVTAQVSVDGALFTDRIDGLARPLDPGPHDIEVASASETPVRLHIVVHEGEKQRVIPITFQPAGVSTDSSAPPPSEAAKPTITPWVYVAGGVALAGFAGFAYFGLTALSDHAALKDGCATTASCTDDQVQSNKTRFWIADGSLLVGILGASVSGYLIYDHARSSGAPRAARAGDVRVTARAMGGPFLQVTTPF
jgi:hypothetical protein